MSTASREGSSRSAATQTESDPTTGETPGAAPAVQDQGVGASPRKRLSWVPSQRGASAAEQPAATARHRRRVAVLVAAVTVVATAGVAFGDDAIASLGHDSPSSDQSVAAGELPDATAHAQAVDAARLALAHAQQTLAAATHVKAGQSDALQASAASLQSLVDDATSTAAALTAATSQLAADDAALGDAESTAVAEQVAADNAAKAAAAAHNAAAQHAAAQKAAAQKAAAQKAAAQKAATQHAAAQKAAAQRAAAQKATTTTHSTTKAPVKTTTTTTVRSTSGTAALSRVPSGGLACTSRGSGAHAASAASLGAAINSYRARHGLKKLRIVTSSSLVRHSLQMANTGGIWHSGHDNIVGCVSNASYSYLVQAWDHSAPHRAQMRRTGISTMYIGDAERGSWLYGAVFFS
ncbi:CAP domain-containing protein [Cellulomonas alba]|uniref:SCP domain-containing protein n=1 Tax=Cellulomonas alba TaxID=3053467 RepID=A0ABT7SGZ9_9CELL|nr:hypothetical protein [Cellulomonas alba]MDM7855474.1 hypothetical protein [Cellulomonas alba]